MQKLPLILATLLISAPMTFAQGVAQPVTSAGSVDIVRPLPERGGNISRAQLIRSSLSAAESNLSDAIADSRMGQGSAAQVIADIRALRRTTEDRIRIDGGELSEASYQTLRGQLRVLHRNIYLLESGG